LARNSIVVGPPKLPLPFIEWITSSPNEDGKYGEYPAKEKPVKLNKPGAPSKSNKS